MSDFMECAACAAKPGAPQLCAACLHNRTELAKVRAKVAELEKEVAFLKEKKLALKNEVSELITKGRK